MQICWTIVATGYKQYIKSLILRKRRCNFICYSLTFDRSAGLFLIRNPLCRTIPWWHDNHRITRRTRVQSYWTWKPFLINLALANVHSPITTATAMLRTVAIAHLQKTTKCLMLMKFDMLDHVKRRGDSLSLKCKAEGLQYVVYRSVLSNQCLFDRFI